MATKKRRIRFPLEDNVKRMIFLREGEIGDPFVIPYATRAEADEGVLTDKVMNPDVTAYAYDRFRYSGQHAAGKGTQTVSLAIIDGTVTVDLDDSNVFRLVLTENVIFNNPLRPLRGQTWNLTIKQDAVGGRTITWGSKVKVVGTINSAANSASILSVQYDDIEYLHRGVISKGFA